MKRHCTHSINVQMQNIGSLTGVSVLTRVFCRSNIFYVYLCSCTITVTLYSLMEDGPCAGGNSSQLQSEHPQTSLVEYGQCGGDKSRYAVERELSKARVHRNDVQRNKKAAFTFGQKRALVLTSDTGAPSSNKNTNNTSTATTTATATTFVYQGSMYTEQNPSPSVVHVFATQQVRIHDAQHVTFRVQHSPAIILENCSDIVFEFVDGASHEKDIQDFCWQKRDRPSPNFSIRSTN